MEGHPITRLINRHPLTFKLAGLWNGIQISHPWLIWNKAERDYARRIKP